VLTKEILHILLYDVLEEGTLEPSKCLLGYGLAPGNSTTVYYSKPVSRYSTVNLKELLSDLSIYCKLSNSILA
jgi:hypothetical protein